MKHRALFAFLALTTGCASMISGSTQRVQFLSTPPGATVNVQGLACTTPAFLDVPRGHPEDSFWNTSFPPVEVTYSMPGYETTTVLLNRGRNPAAVAGNIATGPIGVVVDYNTGAIYRFDTDVVDVTLLPARP